MEKLTEQERVRRDKLTYLKDKGINPFGQKFERTSNAKEIQEKFANVSGEDLENQKNEVVIAGRIKAKRRQGKIGFIDVQDKFGNVQVYISKEIIGEENYDTFIKSDIGDIVGISGYVFRTKTEALTVKCEKFTHLVKALRPLPEKFHGLQDVEEARRRRYLDLIMNDDARKVAFMRPRIIRAIQKYFDEDGFVEVETPVLTPILGGAAARPFVTHYNALDMPYYLRIATELNLKRLLVGGMEGVYEIGRIFRNEGIDSTHNPEFTTIEAYKAYSDYEGMMDLVEKLFQKVAMEVCGTLDLPKGDKIIHLGNFRRLNMVDAIKEACGVDFWQQMSFEDACSLAKEHGIKIEPHFTGVGHIINEFFEKYCEEMLIQPTIVYGHPIEISPLAKKNEKDPRFTDRFELFIDGKEYCNAFSELNDPIDQLERFEEQLKERNLGNDEANDIDMDFVEALQYGMPPAGGIGIGIDRLVMLLTNSDSIRDVLLFPQMKTR